MIAQEPFFLGPLAVWHHTPKTPQARVLLVHGLSEHSGRHLNTALALVEQGFEVVRFDLRGAGHSGGRRQWIQHFEDYVEDTVNVYNWIYRELAPLPLFVLGHSLGGGIAIYFTARYQRSLSGLVLSAPAYLVGSAISPVKIAIGRALSGVTPTLKIKGNSDLSSVSRDPEVVEAYGKDPLCTHYNTVRQGNEILNALELIPEEVCKLNLPTLICHGSHDRIIRLEGSFQMLRTLASKDKILHILPSGYHEPHNDLDKEHYFALVSQWLRNHSAA